MKQYKVYKHPSGTTEAVKQGWSWPGFFFTWIWALVKKQWGMGIGLFVLLIILSMISNAGDAGAILGGLGSLVVCIVVGASGNSWRENNLVSRGYELSNTVTAANSEGALALHVKADSAAH